MGDLIERDWVLKRMVLEPDYEVVQMAPAVDAVPEHIVRCDECVCCSMWNDTLVCQRIADVMDSYYHGTVDVVKPDDYCSRGIRSTSAQKRIDGGETNATD